MFKPMQMFLIVSLAVVVVQPCFGFGDAEKTWLQKKKMSATEESLQQLEQMTLNAGSLDAALAAHGNPLSVHKSPPTYDELIAQIEAGVAGISTFFSTLKHDGNEAANTAMAMAMAMAMA